jgi:hypothetical protein
MMMRTGDAECRRWSEDRGFGGSEIRRFGVTGVQATPQRGRVSLLPRPTMRKGLRRCPVKKTGSDSVQSGMQSNDPIIKLKNRVYSTGLKY